MKMKPIYWLAIILVIIVGFALKKYQGERALEERQQAIHQRGASVMPFDLNKTTHAFSTTNTGGIMQVTVKDPSDRTQIELIRSHLKQEADNFNKADFSDPTSLHGVDMPGLDVLSQSQGKFSAEYVELLDGAQLTFTTSDPEITNAIHMWFMAQVADHGSDATAIK